MVAAAFSCGKEDFMSKESFEAIPDVMDAKQLAEALQISRAGAYHEEGVDVSRFICYAY